MRLTGYLAAAALGFGVWAGAPAAHAQDAENSAARLAQARQVVETTQVEETARAMFEQLTPLMMPGLTQQLNLTPADARLLQTLLTEELLAEVDTLVDAAARSYANSLTLEELSDINAFLATPSGQAMLASQQAAQTDLEQAGQSIGIQAASRALTRLAAEQAGGQ